ncbi:zinc finger homeobox protein 4-like [Hypomesus transpacificus]|uniref:zinc finger homeobox protein 4-like n=1 Tax=Hypomesus transpacificus TaxID=137520 RepID=UPI001F075A51|nr:zinc finger homeobox protein 4-like [Hypomesus transpacificus]
MDSCEGGGGGGRGEGEERKTASPPLSPAASLDVGWSSCTSASAPAKEPLTQPEPEPEQGGAEGSEAREETQGGELTEGGGHKRGDGQSLDAGEKETDEEEVFADEGEEAVCIEPHGSRDGGEDEEKQEEAISNQSQTKSKCSLLPQQSHHSSSSSTVMANGAHYSKIPTSPKPRPSLFIAPELSPSPAASPKLSPSTSPKLSPSPSTSPKHFTYTSSSPSPLSQAELRDTLRGDQGCTPGFPQSFKSQQSALAFPLMAPESTSMHAEEGGAAGVTQTSIANGDGAKAPEPNDSQGESEVDEERNKEREDAVLQSLQQDLSPNSLSSHMTLMHSRNSCKTLKCPKCNWHYKSQQTLQAHMKEKHPETEGQCVCGGPEGKCVCGGNRDACLFCSSGQSHPRLARGETYACGYKPFRCEVCDYATSSKGNLSIHMQSDKHLNNVQAGGHANGHAAFAQAEQAPHPCGPSDGYAAEEQAFKHAHHAVTPPAKHMTPAHSAGKRWRCDVCDYETSIARNLRIHTTSEKHTHNMMRLQRGYYLSHCRSLTPQLAQLKHLNGTGGELSLTMRLSSQQVPELPATLGSTLTPSPSPSPSPPPPPSLSPTPALSQAVFQCLVCFCFSSDRMEALEQHLSAPRSLPQSDWCSLVAGGCHCRLCGYTTPLRANFSLHCQTDRHRSRYQLAAHIREGGATSQEEANLVAKGNPVQLRCNLCDHVTNSVEKLRAHCLGAHHEASQSVYKFLQKYDSAVEEGSWLLHCLPCNFSSPSKLHLTRHTHSAAHQQKEGLLGRPPPTEGGLMEGEELAAIFTIRKCSTPDAGDFNDLEDSSEDSNCLSDKTKDTDTWGERWAAKETDDTSGEDRERRDSMPPAKRPSPGSEEMESPFLSKRPRTHQHTAHQQPVQCPLCQVKLAHTHLRHHLTHLHSVAQDCVDKLISTVLPSSEQSEGPFLPEPDPQQQNPQNASSSKDSSLQNNGTLMEDPERDPTTPKHVPALLTPPLEEQLSAEPDTPNGHAQSLSPLLPHSPPSPPGDLALSDRHGYKFRCSKCSLAFPTREKLQVHWQYHAMRAATECPLCSRQCRSQEALQRHLNNTHTPQEMALGQNALLERGQADQGKSTASLQAPATAQDQGEDEALEDGGEGMSGERTVEPNREGGGDETMDDEVEKEDRPLELAGKPGLGASEPGPPAPQQEESGSEPSHSLPPRRSSSSTMERYMDPTRPYKCSVCSESFTQKTILLVHYNSVSHLHRARRAQQDSGPLQTDAPRAADPRPYRCKVCGVGYSQSSTLDIHLRSVLHQSRARAAQTQTPQSLAQTPAPPSARAAASSPLPRGGEESSRGLGAASPSLSSPAGPSSRGDGHGKLLGQAESLQAKRRVADLLATRGQQTLMLLQQQQQLAQAQAQLQQHTSLLQSQLFNPALLQHFSLGPEALMKQHFSITPDSLLSLQQQLLLPFYLSGELNLGPEFTPKGPETRQTASAPSPDSEQPRGETIRDGPAPNPTEPPQEPPCEAADDYSRTDQRHGAPSPGEEGEEGVKVKTEREPEEGEARVGHLGSLVRHGDCSCPPPRVPYAAVSGGAFRALLGSFGYELALQYTQGTQRSPAQPQAGGQEDCESARLERQSEVDLRNGKLENGETERCPEENGEEAESGEAKGCPEERECGECGKLFSDFLVLKSHQEYVHKLLLPPTMLESFSRQYRIKYDRLYPLTHTTLSVEKAAPAASPTPDPEAATSPPKLLSHPAPASTPSPAKALTPAPAPATPSPPPSPSHPESSPRQEAAVPSTPSPDSSPPAPQPKASVPLPLLPLPSLPIPPMPFPIDLPLLSPAMIQSMALQSQAMFSTMDPGLNSDLTKFYQSQLSPVLLGQQPQLSPALLGQQPQLSPALLGQQPQLSPGLSGQNKRARTRISEEQLNVLRQHFNISSLPSDEQINKMAALSGLPHKVIKHWFRNTLFKERQRDKDSPYNFSNPPTTSLEKTGEEPPALSQSDPPLCQSPAPPAQHPSQPQRQETPRGEHHRSRRSSRTRFTEPQLETLQGVFEASPYPREEEYDKLSALLSLPNRVIVVWFQNARQRARKTQERGSDGGREERPEEGANRNRGDGTQRGRRRKRDQSDNDDDDEGQCDSQNENSMDLAYEYYAHSDSPGIPPIPLDPHAIPHHTDKECTRDEVESSHPGDADFKTPSTSEKTREAEGEALDSEMRSQRRETPSQKHPKTPQLSSDISPPKPSTTSHSGSQSSPAALQRSIPAPAPVSPHSPPPPAPAKFLPPPGSPTDSHQPQSKAQPQTKAQAQPQFQCSLCPVSLPSFQLWQEHQTRHLLAAQSQVKLLHPGFTDCPLPYMLLHPSQNLLTSQLLSGAMSQMHPGHTHHMMSHMSNAHANLAHGNHALANLSHPSLPSPKQGSKVAPEVRQGCEAGLREREEEQRRDKRQRTTITPEQLEVLYQRYSLDSNPTRGVLEGIARDVGLGRRVVQVWFQNTRARERKGQFRSLGAGAGLSLSHSHLRCPFCRALFKVRSALDAHIRSRHGAEAERVGYSLPMGAAPLGNFGDLSSYAYGERQCSSMSPFLPPSSGAITNTRDLESGNATLNSDSLAFDLSNQEGEDEDEEEAEEGVEEEYGCEEGSSLADPASPSPEASGAATSAWGDKPAQRHHHHNQQQRQRTHMSHLQVLQLRAFYRNHRTPSRLECEALGQDLGLARRVVQVWFQNARAKEKRARSLSNEPATGERDQMELTARAGERDRA